MSLKRPILFVTCKEYETELDDILSKLRRRLRNCEAVGVARHLTWLVASREHGQVIEDLHRWVHVLHYVSSIIGCAFLPDLPEQPMTSSHLEALKKTFKFAVSLSVSLRSTEEPTRSAEALLKVVISLR